MKRRIYAPMFPVPAGKYIISEKKNEVLSAYLGTCAGLALCDRKANIGGLIHLLLPEPATSDHTGKPENYALTGVPVFVKELCNRGAKIDDLEATIAGGALIGDISGIDMKLDIGGRTVEITEKILSNAGIPVLKRETGGFFSCRLSLNLNNMECNIDPIYDPYDTGKISFEKPDIEQVKTAIEDVNSIPQIVFKIVRMIREHRYNIQDIAKEVRQDQVLSAKLIKLCNSAFFNNRLKADSIDRAIVLLGEKNILQVVMSAAFKDFFTGSSKGYSLCKGGLFNHAIGTALMCEQLSYMSGKIQPDTAYTAGLLHDIGKIVLDQYMSKAFPFFYRRIQVANDILYNAEQETFGITHDEVGGMLAEKWELPDNIIESTKNHHQPDNSGHHMDLTNIVYLADLLMSRFLVGQELENMNANYLKQSLVTLGVESCQFSRIIERIPDQIFHLPISNSYRETIMHQASVRTCP